MRISEEEARRRLSSARNITFIPSRPNVNKGPWVPEQVRDVIGTLALLPGASANEIGREFGVVHQTVSNYKTGHIGGLPANSERSAKVAERIESIKDTALSKLMQSLGLIDEGKMSDLDAVKLSQISTNMSRVVNNMILSPAATGAQVNITIYAPEAKKEASYKTIDV